MKIELFVLCLFGPLSHVLTQTDQPNSNTPPEKTQNEDPTEVPSDLGPPPGLQGPYHESEEAPDYEEEEDESSSIVKQTQKLLDHLSETLENYSDDFRPRAFGPPVEVKVRLFINGMLGFSEENMNFQLSMDMLQVWTDERLQYEHPHGYDPSKFKFITLSAETMKKIWAPDTYFYNQEESDEETNKIPIGFNRLYSTGRIAINSKNTPVLRCAMSLEYFPLDKQVCTIYIGSASYSDDDITYDWFKDKKPAVYLSLGYIDAGQDMALTSYRWRRVTRALGVRNYTNLACDLLLERSIGYYLCGVYFPSTLIVIISWFGYWLQRDATGERMGLGVTCILTISALLLSSQSASSKASSLKAIDTYMGVSFAFVFVALLHSTVTGYLLRRQKEPDETEEDAKGGQNGFGATSAEKMKLRRERIRRWITKFELISRFLFPFGFILFNLIYWIYYYEVSRVPDPDTWHDLVTYGRFIDEL